MRMLCSKHLPLRKKSALPMTFYNKTIKINVLVATLRFLFPCRYLPFKYPIPDIKHFRVIIIINCAVKHTDKI